MIDQTGYGYQSGGFAPRDEDRRTAYRLKHEMDRMSDAMSQLDPTIQRAVERAIRTQVQNGANPAEARRAAYGSVSGQLMSDMFLAMRRGPNPLMGQGDPINYGASVMQGVAGGGFGINILNPAGRSSGMDQRVQGGGMLSGQVAINMAKDMMRNLYGEGSNDPARLYGFNMEEAGGIFQTLAGRGALGTMGTFKTFSDPKSADAINQKLAAAKKQETDKMVLAALEGTTAGNIDEQIAKLAKENPKGVAALGNIKLANSALIMDDANTKRISDTVKEVTKGLANLSDIYGDLTSPQLLAKMEGLSGIRITNQTEARKASTVTRELINSAGAAGLDAGAVMDRLIASSGRNRDYYGGIVGLDGSEGARGLAIGQNFGIEVTKRAMSSSYDANNRRTLLNEKYGMNIAGMSGDAYEIDVQRQVGKATQQSFAVFMANASASGSLSGNKDFVAEAAAANEQLRLARSPAEVAAAEARAEAALQRATKLSSRQWAMSNGAKIDIEGYDLQDWVDETMGRSAIDTLTPMTELALEGKGLRGDENRAAQAALKRGVGGALSTMLAIDPNTQKVSGSKSREEIDKILADLVDQGHISKEEAALVGRMRNSDGTVDMKMIQTTQSEIANASGGLQSSYDQQQGADFQRSLENKTQRSKFSDENGLSLKKIANSIMTPGSKGLSTDAEKMFALEAMHAAGLGGSTAKPIRFNTDDGYSQKEMDDLRALAGGELDLHTGLGFDSEKAMLEDMQSGTGGERYKKKRRFEKALERQGNLVLGGTSDERTAMSAEGWDKSKERLERFEVAVRLRAAAGLEVGEFNPAMQEYMDTGTLPEDSLRVATDGKQSLYDDKGKGRGGGWLGSLNPMLAFHDARNGVADKVHFERGGYFSGMADDVLGDGRDAAIKLNDETGGALVEGLEAQLESYRDAYAKGGRVMDTKIGDEAVKLDLGAEIDKLTKSLEVLRGGVEKGSASTGVMHVELMHVRRQEND